MRGRVVVIVRSERGAARLGREREEPGGRWAVTRRWHADVLRVWQPSLRPRPGEGVARRGRSGSERGEERRRADKTAYFDARLVRTRVTWVGVDWSCGGGGWRGVRRAEGWMGEMANRR